MGIQEPILYLWPRLRPGSAGQPSWLLCGLTTLFGSEKRCGKMNSRSQAKETGSSWSLCFSLSFTWAVLWFLLSPAEVLAHKPGKQMLQRLAWRFHRLVSTWHVHPEGAALHVLFLMVLPTTACSRWSLGLCLEHPQRMEGAMLWPFLDSPSSPSP